MGNGDKLVNLSGLKAAYDNVSKKQDDLKSAITEQTYNLIVGKISNALVGSTGLVESSTEHDLYYAPVTQGTSYTIKTEVPLIGGFFTDIPVMGSATYNNTRIFQQTKTITSPITGYVAVRINKSYQYPQIVEGSEDKEYIAPLTATDNVARALLSSIGDDVDYLHDFSVEIANDVNASKQNVVYKNTPTINYTGGQYIRPSGALATGQAAGFKTTGFIELQDTDILVNIPATNFVTNAYILMVAYYADQSYSSFLSGVSPNGQPILSLIPNGAKYVVFGNNASASGLDYGLDASIEIQGSLKRYGDTTEATATFVCPDSYDLIVGDTFELFYKGIVNSFDSDAYFVSATCEIGANYKKRFIVTPSTAGTYSLSLRLYDTNGSLLDTRTVNLIVHATPTSPSANRTILCVGDSLTQAGIWVAELYRRLKESGGTPSGFNLSNVTFIGNRERDNANYEGYGGYTFARYNAESVDAYSKVITCSHDKDSSDQHSIYQASNGSRWKLETINSDTITIINVSGSVTGFQATGTLTWVSGGTHHTNITYTASADAPGNPFWDSVSGKVDFDKYATAQGAASIDYVYVLLGWNNWSTPLSTTKQSAQTFINNVHSAFPNAKVVLIGLQIPSRDGLAVNYGASGNSSDYMYMMKYVHDLDEIYDEIVDDNSNVYHVNLSGQFDTEHNMPQSTRPVNLRNAETEVYQTNGVHPAESGQLQIADAATRHIIGILN